MKKMPEHNFLNFSQSIFNKKRFQEIFFFKEFKKKRVL